MANATYPKPPISPPNWQYTPEQITEAIDKVCASDKAQADELVALPEEKRTFENGVRPQIFSGGHDSWIDSPALFLQHVHPDDAIRNSSIEAEKKMTEFGLKESAREDVYKALKDVEANVEKNGEKLNAEEKRFLERILRDRRRLGLALEPEKREKLLELNTKLSNLQVDFRRALNEEKGSLLFTREELDGVPEATIEGYEKDGDKFKVTFKTPDIVPIFQYANVPETRRKAYMGYEGRTISNVPVLDEILKIRRQIADLMGFETYADFILDVKMAKNSKTALDFLYDLKDKLTPIGQAEKKVFLQMKKDEHAKRGWDFDNELYLWDYRYYDRLWTEQKLGLDDEKVKEYFPVNKVVPTILDIYRKLLSVNFYPIPKDSPEGKFWHEDVQGYAVWDHQDGKDGDFLGYMYLDLFPRENKYGHAAVWGLIPGFTKEDGERSYPVVCMVANLAKPTPNRPALMKHSDVVTFFHEMGHAFHGLCSKTQIPRFHGTSVARDFVEAPSQMLENWCFIPEQLKEMSEHFETGEHLPDDLIEGIVKSKNANLGLFNLRQLFLGIFDMTMHTSKEDLDLSKLWCETRENVSLVSTAGEVVGGQSAFGHIAGGYEAGYYGYLYSQVFAADMFETIFAADPMSPASGMKYRDSILRPGGSREEMDSLKEFLGREPNNEAFLKQLLSGAEPEAKL